MTNQDNEFPWYQSEVGAKLIEAEKKELEDILSRFCGYHLAFLGEPGLTSLAQNSLIPHRILVNPKRVAPIAFSESFSLLAGEIESLPLLGDSIDVVMLSHSLEHVANPHEVLREAHRVLIPEGHVVITGFNPLSWWGMWHAYRKLLGKMPATGRMLSLNRIKDWLTLLNFQIIGAKMFYFRPPITRAGLHRQLQFLERLGEGGWPFCGGAYTLTAVKRVVPLTPIRAKWRLEKSLWPAATESLPKATTTLLKNNLINK